MIDIDIAIAGDGWPARGDLETLADETVAAVAGTLGLRGESELSLVFTSDTEIRTLNAAWRNRDSATNVLSFPAAVLGPGDQPGPLLGDVVIAHETVRREADLEDKPFRHHLQHLLVHGILHLLGYDHEDDAQARIMEGLERDILHSLGISDPYAVAAPDDSDE